MVDLLRLLKNTVRILYIICCSYNVMLYAALKYQLQLVYELHINERYLFFNKKANRLYDWL